MKVVGNSRENIITIPAPVFFEWEQDGNTRTGIQIRYYRISGTIYFNQEHSDYDWESETQNGNIT